MADRRMRPRTGARRPRRRGSADRRLAWLLTCLRACLLARLPACLLADLPAWLPACLLAWLRACVLACFRACSRAWGGFVISAAASEGGQMFIYIYIYIYIYIHMYVCIYIHIFDLFVLYIYTHTLFVHVHCNILGEWRFAYGVQCVSLRCTSIWVSWTCVMCMVLCARAGILWLCARAPVLARAHTRMRMRSTGIATGACLHVRRGHAHNNFKLVHCWGKYETESWWFETIHMSIAIPIKSMVVDLLYFGNQFVSR